MGGTDTPCSLLLFCDSVFGGLPAAYCRPPAGCCSVCETAPGAQFSDPTATTSSGFATPDTHQSGLPGHLGFLLILVSSGGPASAMSSLRLVLPAPLGLKDPLLVLTAVQFSRLFPPVLETVLPVSSRFGLLFLAMFAARGTSGPVQGYWCGTAVQRHPRNG